MPTKLTLKSIKDLKPRAARFTVWDTEVKGLGLRVTPDDMRAYVLKYRAGGVQRWFTIGRHGSPWTPEQARDEAKRLIGDVVKGGDPAAEKIAARKAATFAELVEIYFAEGVAHKKPRTVKTDRGRARLHLVPLIGRKRVEDVTRSDIERMQVDVVNGKTAAKSGKRKAGSVATGGRGVAAQCVALVSTILQFAADRKMIAINVAKGVKKPAVRKVERFLNMDELKRLAEALDKELEDHGTIYPIAAIRLLALTGARRSEIVGLRREHVDLERGLLHLPDSKTGAKPVYLSRGAVDLLQHLPVVADNPHVIAGEQKGRPSGAVDKVWARVRRSAGLPRVRLHDLRHTFASAGVNSGLGLPVVGALLGHRNSATTERYAHLQNSAVRHASDAIGETIAAVIAPAARDTENNPEGELKRLRQEFEALPADEQLAHLQEIFRRKAADRLTGPFAAALGDRKTAG